MRTIIEDTRQQKGKHEIKHQCFEADGIKLLRCKIPFGDYCLPPERSVDTKEDMKEIASNIINEHTRFRNECIAAADSGTHLFILVENEDGIRSIDDVHNWVNPDYRYRPNVVDGDRLEKSMKTMHRKYGVTFLFCAPQDSSSMIIDILQGRYDNEQNT